VTEIKVILLFKNNIGKVYKDKITIGSNKFPFEALETVNFKKVKDRKYNVIAFFFGLICFLIALFNFNSTKIFTISILFSLLCGVFYLVYTNKKYFIIIDFKQNQNSQIFKIKKELKEEAKDFIIAVSVTNNMHYKRNF
jgi:hypothetical protein